MAVWPAKVRFAGVGRPVRLADPWLDPGETFDGETALEDLPLVGDAEDAARILARYLVVRLIRSAVTPGPGYRADLELAAARSYLGLIPPHDPDRRALTPFLQGSGPPAVDERFVRQIDAAAAVGIRRSQFRSSFALLHAGYRVLRARSRHGEAALLARRIGSFCAQRSAPDAARLWRLRAGAHERRSAAS